MALSLIIFVGRDRQRLTLRSMARHGAVLRVRGGTSLPTYQPRRSYTTLPVPPNQ
jgi:hypothetical protein